MSNKFGWSADNSKSPEENRDNNNRGNNRNGNGNDTEAFKNEYDDNLKGVFGNIFNTGSFHSKNAADVIEMDQIEEELRRVLKKQKDSTVPDNGMDFVPTLKLMTVDQSKDLPGVILHHEVNKVVYLLPVLFYKKGMNVITQTIRHGRNEQVQRYRTPASRINKEFIAKLKKAYGGKEGYNPGIEAKKVKVVSNYLIDIGQYVIPNPGPIGISNIVTAIMDEWYSAMMNYSIISTANSPSKADRAQSGFNIMTTKNDISVGVDIPAYPQLVDGKRSAANLRATLSLSSRPDDIEGSYRGPVRQVSSTYFNVIIDTLTTGGRPRNDIIPLVPVVILGRTIPGEVLNSNDTFISALLGVVTMLSINIPGLPTTPYRYPNVGKRGSLVNFTNLVYHLTGFPPTERQLTQSAFTSSGELVSSFIRDYVSESSVLAIDLGSNTDQPSITEIWHGLYKSAGKVTSYTKVLNLAFDSLTKGEWSKYLHDEAHNQHVWQPGDDVLMPTGHIVPVGTGYAEGEMFNLEEFDPMMMRQPQYWGNREAAINEYRHLIGRGGQAMIPAQRQDLVVNMLTDLFGIQTDIIGWKNRFMFDDRFLHTVSNVINRTTNIQVDFEGGGYYTGSDSSDYLHHTSAARVNGSTGYGASRYR